MTSDVGPIELSFANGSVLVFDAGSDGEGLAESSERWVDPFAPPLSPENKRYVEASGKWTAFDVSNHLPYAGLVGSVIDDIEVNATPDGKVVGVTIWAGGAVLRAEVEADDLNVDCI